MDNENPEAVIPQTDTGTVESPQTESQETGDVSLESPRSDQVQNLTKAVAKFRNDLKQKDQEIATLRGAGQQQAAPEEGWQRLEETINNAVNPLREKLEQNEREAAIVDVFSMEYSKELQPEITEAFKTLPDSLPFADRLRLARNNAIAENIETITKLSTERGKNEAYSNQNLKSQQRGMGETNPGRGESEKSIYEKFTDKELTQSQIAEHFDEIQTEKKKALGIK